MSASTSGLRAVLADLGTAHREEILICSAQNREILVLHPSDDSPESDTNIQLWPSGRAKVKNYDSLDQASQDFWRAVSRVVEPLLTRISSALPGEAK